MPLPGLAAPSDGAVLTVIRDAANGGRGFTAWSGRRMYLYTEDGANSFTFELAPKEITYGELGNEYVKTDRPGATPLLQFKGGKLVKMTFSFTMSDRQDYFKSQIPAITALSNVAKSTARVMVRYSKIESGLWRITELSLKSVERHPLTNEPTRCTADMTLEVASDPDPSGPVSGPPVTSVPITKPAPRTYVVRPGDTLNSISMSVYGTSVLWQRIWDANPAVVMPWDTYPGQTLLIP